MSYDGKSRVDEELLQVISTRRRRDVLRYLQKNGEEPVGIATLAEAVGESSDTTGTLSGHRRVEVALHHVDLPKLQAVGLLEYDSRERTVSYHGTDWVRSLLEFVDEQFE